jgi:ribosomal protein L11 methyltransferase
VAGAITVSDRPLASIDDQFDIVLANLLAPVVVDLAKDLRRVLAPSGALIVSGVLEGAHDHVRGALEPLQVVQEMTRDGWAALLTRH